MPASAFAEKKLAELMKGGTVVGPAKLFLALCEEEQTRNLTGSTLKGELTYEGYGRVEINLPEEEIVEGTESAVTKLLNKAAILLKLNTGSSGKTKAKTFALVDAATNGNVWAYGTFAEVLEIIKALTKVEIEPKKLEVTFE